MYLIFSHRWIGFTSTFIYCILPLGRQTLKKTSNVRRLNSQRAFRGLFQTAGIWAHVTSSVLMPFLCCFFAFTPWIPPSERSTPVLWRLRDDLMTVTLKQPFQEHTRSSLFSVNFSVVLLLFTCTLFFPEMSRGMLFFLFAFVTAVVWDTGSWRQQDCYDLSCLSERRDWF